MEDYIVLAFMGGFVAAAILFTYSSYCYKRTLVLLANSQSPEKLINGKFYYLVEESEFHDMKQAKTTQALASYMRELKNNKVVTPQPHA
jgi:hypothetical protein